MEIRNSGKGRVTLVRTNGPNIVIEPGQTAVIPIVGEPYRLACWECGLADASHHTWCPLWRPYEASE